MKFNTHLVKKLTVACVLSLAFLSCAFAEPDLPSQNPDKSPLIYAKASSDSDFIPAKQLQNFLNPSKLRLHSSTALVLDLKDGTVLYEKESSKQMPIASLTKLMTAMVTLDKQLDLTEKLQITREDRDRLRGSRSRLNFGTTLSRSDMIKIALAASENRASKALARTYPGGEKAFIDAMNQKAKVLGMNNTHYLDSTGLHAENVSTASDLAKLLVAANQYPLIREYSTTGKDYVTDLRSGRKVEFFNTNRLVRTKSWDINISKTGYISDAGHCLVMHTEINNRPMAIVLLNSWGKASKFGDSNRIRNWLMKAEKRAEKTVATL